jgi:hypothetical protein
MSGWCGSCGPGGSALATAGLKTIAAAEAIPATRTPRNLKPIPIPRRTWSSSSSVVSHFQNGRYVVEPIGHEVRGVTAERHSRAGSDASTGGSYSWCAPRQGWRSVVPVQCRRAAPAPAARRSREDARPSSRAHGGAGRAVIAGCEYAADA